MSRSVRLSPRRVEHLVSVTGVVLLAALLAWVQVSAALSGGRSGPFSLLIVATGITFAAARLITRWCRWVVPAVVAVSAAMLLLLPGGTYTTHGRILGYANATCAFLVLGSAAALMVAARQPFRVVRAATLLMVTTFAAIVVLIQCRAAVAGIALVGLAWLSRRWERVARTAILGGASLVVSALVVSTTMGALSIGVRGASSEERVLVAATLSSVRVLLWHDALTMVKDAPFAGVGPGRFAEISPIATDPDLRWAHHEFLQLAAETGLVGLALGIALAAWVFTRLWHSQRDLGAALAALAMAALLTQSTIDYVLHFPAVTLTAAALLAAGASPLPADRRSPSGL